MQPRQMAPRAVQEPRPPEGAPPGAEDRGRGKEAGVSNAAVSKAASLRAAAPVKAATPRPAAPGKAATPRPAAPAKAGNPGLVLPQKRPLPAGPGSAAAQGAEAVSWGADGIPPRAVERQLPRPTGNLLAGKAPRPMRPLGMGGVATPRPH
mmetsp:Transcript_76728/g.225272  ORF Transcript_76728/g.225272 Transcript_76728/m.225272 type:complete len:151 (+) Transcript_76728:596-1048(+)